ncbi:MAG: hypothetical protein K6B12_01120 [Clostridiales bacterium]|nr:hypothetical protein [Clostridiales bacterium]
MLPAPAAAASGIATLSGANYPPSSMEEGSSFSITGTINSTQSLEVVTVGVVSDATGKWVDSATYKATPKTKVFNIATADSHIKFGTLPKGSYSYRIAVKYSGGTSEYLLSKPFSVDAAQVESSFTLQDEAVPVSIKEGSSFSVAGTITSAARLLVVTVGVVDSSGKWVDAVTYANRAVNSKTFDISEANASLDFSSLEEGTYSYRVAVKDANNTSKYLISKSFTVTEGDSAFTLTGETYPTALMTGDSFSLSGKITSALRLETITIGVVDEKTAKWVDGATFTVRSPGTKTYDVSAADESIRFGSLPEGSYTYRIAVKDKKGTSKYLLKKPFTVTAFKLSGDNSPAASMTQGTAFSPKGTITSGRKIETVTVGVVSGATGKWVYGATAKAEPGSKSFDAASVASSIDFTNLPAGSYTYRIAVRDESGFTKYVKKTSFTVKASSASASGFAVSGARYPEDMYIGVPFNVAGIVTSQQTIDLATVGVVSKKTGKWVSGAYYQFKSPKSKTIDISKAASSIKIQNLPAGEYTFRIAVRDVKGTTKYVMIEPFKLSGLDAFETYLSQQGFPKTYWPALKKLHSAHPTWQFLPAKTGMTFDTALSKEAGKNYSTTYEVTPTYSKGNELKYYLDPRNYLTEEYIFAFMDHRYLAAASSTASVKRLVSHNSSCFMNNDTFIGYLTTGGQTAGINPTVLAAMIVQEQGWTGGSNDLISGSYTGTIKLKSGVLSLKGYYNYFNIGAYYGSVFTGTSYSTVVNATRRGLWWAAGEPNYNGVVQSTTFSRPWKTKKAALQGGAQWYKYYYVDKGQNTFYTKKFNVCNGTANAGEHQYETYIAGAAQEGKILGYAYTGSEKNLKFYIPVYNGIDSVTQVKKPY